MSAWCKIRIGFEHFDNQLVLQIGGIGKGPLAGLAALGLGGLAPSNTGGLNPAGKHPFFLNLYLNKILF